MSDFNSSLPVRTEQDGDVVIKVADSVTPSQQLKVNPDGSIDAVVTATDLDIRDLSATQDNVAISDGTNTVAVNVDGSTNAVVTATDLDIRDLDAATDNVQAWIVDEAGAPFTSANPLPVTVLESEGEEINDFNQGTAIAAAATDNHDYTVTAAKILHLTQIEAAASGKMKVEIQVESGVASDIFATKFVKLNSTANPNISVTLKEPIQVAAGVRVRVIRTNLDHTSQNLYSTICGHEV